MTRVLHVANGSSTTQLISAAGIPGALSIWADPLYEGPVPGNLDDRGLLAVRARFLSAPGDESYAATVRGLREWRQVIVRTDAYDELVLWFEHDLFDQLNLIQLLPFIAGMSPPPRRVSLVELGSFPGRPAFKGLGELTPEELAPLFDTRREVEDERYKVAERAWAAFRHSTPKLLEELCRSETTAMPFLNPALKRFLEEYPWAADGLSRTERRVLEVASTGPIDLWEAFVHMHDGERAYYVTDLSFLAMLRRLSLCRPPVVAIAGASVDADRIPEGWLSITEPGREVLGGGRDWIATYGIDRWLGGVHLTDHQMWRFNQDARRLEFKT